MQRRLRNLVFMTMLALAVVGLQERLFAFDGEIESFCDSWEDGAHWDCTDCSTDNASEPGYAADGSCDFSAIEDGEELLQTAAAYMQDSWDACWYTCDQDYAEYIAGWYETNGNPFDPCYEAWQDPWNWVTWDSVDGDAGPTTTWSCTCNRFFWGECGE